MASKQSYASAATGKDSSKNENESKKSEHKEANTKDGNQGSEDKQKSTSSSQHKEGQTHNNENNKPKHSNPNSNQTSNNNPQQARGRDNSSRVKHNGPYTADEYMRRSDHIPATQRNAHSPHRNGDTEKHYILTLLLDQEMHDYTTSLRTKYFPPEINRLDAHITLFHALPGSKLPRIKSDITEICSRQRPFPIVAEEPYSPRNINVLIRASSPKFAVEGIQKQLRQRWEEFLSDQDNRGLRPHWTVLNKVDDTAKVQESLKQIQAEFERREGQVLGLVLWRYDRGNWKDREAFEFGSRRQTRE